MIESIVKTMIDNDVPYKEIEEFIIDNGHKIEEFNHLFGW